MGEEVILQPDPGIAVAADLSFFVYLFGIGLLALIGWALGKVRRG